MSKLLCKCGAILSDIVYPSPSESEGRLLGEQSQERLQSDFGDLVVQLVEAIRNGRRTEWIAQHFDMTHYPADISDSELIADLFSRCLREHSLSVAECPTCGRLHVQTAPGENAYRSFLPDDPGYHLILSTTSNI